MITLGSAFSGIGGFELGLERSSIPDLKTIWQIERNEFCRKVLARHWPNALRYNDIRQLDYSSLEVPDILCAGFPCQDFSIQALRGKDKNQAGLKGVNSGLWYNLVKLIGILRPRIILLENVPTIINIGLPEIAGAFSSLGYDMQWTIISARSMGACHIRERWFTVAYPNRQYGKALGESWAMENTSSKKTAMSECSSGNPGRIYPKNYWKGFPTEPGICRIDDGIPDRVDRIKALGNAIVPACSEYVGNCLADSGLIDHLIPRAICGGLK